MGTKAWLSFDEATEIARTRHKVSVGYAQAIVKAAMMSGEARCGAPGVYLAADDGIVGMDLRPPEPVEQTINCEDFLDWLARHQMQAQAPLRRQPLLARAKEAAAGVWGNNGPPLHLPNAIICREITDWLKQHGQTSSLSDATILRAVGRKK